MKELEDFEHFPAILRQYQMEYIGYAVRIAGIYNPLISCLKKQGKRQTMYDLCSGSGQPAQSIYNKSGAFDKLILSDKYPEVIRIEKNNTNCEVIRTDALKTEFEKDTTYTMFNAFHHFSHQEQIVVLKKISASGARAIFAEILEPTPLCFIKILIATIPGPLLLSPFIRPFSLLRLLMIPLNIITIATDGIISVFKSKSAKAYQKKFQSLNLPVKVLKMKSRFGSIIVITVNTEQ